MSEELVSQKMKRVCEGCGAVKEWELVGVQEAAINEMQDWYLIIRNVLLDGRFTKITVNACSLACVPTAAIKLALPKTDNEPLDTIDLASLRAENLAN